MASVSSTNTCQRLPQDLTTTPFDSDSSTRPLSCGRSFSRCFDLCNRCSPDQGSESVDMLNARVIQTQIRRCMEFFKFADAEYFERMGKATEADSSARL
jgi:hypothetical protein